MGGIHGLGGVGGPSPERPSDIRERNRETTTPSQTNRDGVELSPEARKASEASRMFQAAKSESGVRSDRVEAARQAIERGDHLDQTKLRTVARRLLELME